MIDFYQHLPLNIDPIAFSIGSFGVRWYAISYVVGFLTSYLVLLWRVCLGESKEKASEFIVDFLLVEFFAIILGGRIGYVIFYNLDYFLKNPLTIISPYDKTGKLIGIFGMSYHGALLAAVLAGFIFVKVKKISFWKFADFVAPAIAAGYFFGRIGNFLNGELYGRVTASKWGMYFSADPTFLRYPSQLIEAFLEGLLLFVLLWFLRKSKKIREGNLFAAYVFGYGFFRFIAEFSREPDFQIGFVFWNLTLGQIFSIIMMFFGVLIFRFRTGKKYVILRSVKF
jgi:phosphatidylglycerol:prolipoprotein diacylglycerol transferase